MLQIHPVLCRAGTMNNYSYILHDDQSAITAVIDPSESEPIITKLQALNLRPHYILNTHHHFDHTDSNLELKELYNAKVVGHIEDSARIPGFDIGVTSGDTFMLGSCAAQIIDVSAHTIGHILYYFPQAKALFTGDTLFNLCIGGIFEGTPSQMFAALERIRNLPDDTLFYPGHEYTMGAAAAAKRYFNNNADISAYLQQAQTRLHQGLPAGPFTLGEEKKCNPYLAAATLDQFNDLF